MRQGPFTPNGPRHGHYAKWNYVPNEQDGTFRLVHQEHPLPDPGAQNYTYSTFMFPIQDLYGLRRGEPLSRGVPSAISPAADISNIPVVTLSAPWPNQQGSLGTVALLPSDLVAAISGRTV
jgi:hypothetical protein